LIYFDNAATTIPINKPQSYYNPSSPHGLGLEAERALKAARNKIFNVLYENKQVGMDHASQYGDVIFTSGGTESNNLAISGYVFANLRRGASLVCALSEHPSLTAPVRFLCQQNWAINTNTLPISGKCLVIISHVNYETGDINDINAIAKTAKSQNAETIILVDGSQGFCKEELNLEGIDMYTFSGHKCHGPLGVGGLWIRKGVRLLPLHYGGGQENGIRAGTENIVGIAQMVDAVSSLYEQKNANYLHVAHIKDIMLGLCDDLPDVEVNSLGNTVSPYILNMSFLGVKGEVLVSALSEKGLYVSMGAACQSKKRKSSALEMMGFSAQQAQSAIRFSFSHLNTSKEANEARMLVVSQVKQLRKMKG